jgi:hypothetical protein
MTRRNSELVRPPSDEAQSAAIEAQVQTITEAKDAIRAAMLALPDHPQGLPPMPAVDPPWATQPWTRVRVEACALSARVQIIASLADKYADMAFAFLAYRPPASKSEVEMQLSRVRAKPPSCTRCSGGWTRSRLRRFMRQ